MFHGIRHLSSFTSKFTDKVNGKGNLEPSQFIPFSNSSIYGVHFFLYHFYFLVNVFKCVEIVMYFLPNVWTIIQL